MKATCRAELSCYFRRTSRERLVRVASSRMRLFLHLRKRRGDLCEYREMAVHIRVGVRDRYGPLLVPPIGLGHHTPVHHRKPVMAPEFAISLQPIAVIVNRFREKH